MSFAVIPTIDLRAGQVVRLRQGDYAQQTSYRVEPLVLARDYAAVMHRAPGSARADYYEHILRDQLGMDEAHIQQMRATGTV